MFYITLWIGKIVNSLVNIVDKKRGSNISGKIALKYNKNLVKYFKNIDLDKTIMITGTNGKTTTTHMVAHALEAAGKKVATNAEGANMMGGVATTLIKNSNLFGKFNKEFLVLEIDERSLKAIHEVLPAKHLCITNLEKDQVQRNGDPDFIYRKFEEVINKDMTIYVNNEEPRSKSLEDKAGKTIYYSVNKNEKSFEKNDFYDVTMPCPKCCSPIKYDYYNLESMGHFKCSNCNFKSEETPNVYISNVNFKNKKITHENETYEILYTTPFYIYNYALCIALCKNFNIEFDDIQKGFKTFINPLERREILEYHGKKVYYLRMKQENPETLQNALDTVAQDKENKAIFMGLFEIKDFPPAYTNTFYFFDCDFKKVVESNVEKYICFSNTVCYDCANRMIYAGADKEKILVFDEEENIDSIMKYIDEVETDNIYIITGMKPYDKIKTFLGQEK